VDSGDADVTPRRRQGTRSSNRLDAFAQKNSRGPRGCFVCKSIVEDDHARLW
jgi:hypothetical protein